MSIKTEILKLGKMKSTNIKLTAVSSEEMLNNKIDNQYNPSVWTEKVKRYLTYDKCQFYLVPKDEHFSYNRFYVSYIADGIYFFSQWSAFSSGISSNGFCLVNIINGEVFKTLFKDSSGKEGYAENCKTTRLSFAKYNTPRGEMVSNCI